MRGTNHLLALTTKVDEITGEVKPLFAFPVQACKATDDGGDVTFAGAAPSGADYKTQYVDTATGEVFAYGDRVRGVKIGAKGAEEFIAIDPDAIAAIEDATKINTLVAIGKIDLDEALAKYGDRVCGLHFIQSPAKNGSPKAYKLTYDALCEQKTGKKVTQKAQAIVTKRTARSRQKLALIFADEVRGCLMMLEIQFAAKMREADAQVLAPQTVEVEDKQTAMAREVIAKMPDGTVAIEGEVDEAVALRQELIDAAINGGEVVSVKKVSETASEDDLTAALEASIG
jgi:non-homologous end joining protein Ku